MHRIRFRLIFRPQGILYESANIQIGYRSEFQGNLGRVQLFYGNKSPATITSFDTNIVFTENSTSGTGGSPLNLDLRSGPTFLEPSKQISRTLNVECLVDFTEIPSLSITYS